MCASAQKMCATGGDYARVRSHKTICAKYAPAHILCAVPRAALRIFSYAQRTPNYALSRRWARAHRGAPGLAGGSGGAREALCSTGAGLLSPAGGIPPRIKPPRCPSPPSRRISSTPRPAQNDASHKADEARSRHPRQVRPQEARRRLHVRDKGPLPHQLGG